MYEYVHVNVTYVRFAHAYILGELHFQTIADWLNYMQLQYTVRNVLVL